WIARCSNFVSHPLAHPVQFLYLLLERVIHDWLRSFSKVLIYAVFDDADDLKGTSPLGAIELEVLADRHVVIEVKPDKCLIDDRDFWRTGVVSIVESPACQQRYSHCLEEIVPDRK